MDDAPQDQPEPPNLRFLRVLVTILTAVMIVGLLTIVVLLVIRLRPAPETALDLPDSITLPDGASAEAFTRGKDWFAVVTDDDMILIFRPDGSLIKSVTISD